MPCSTSILVTYGWTLQGVTVESCSIQVSLSIMVWNRLSPGRLLVDTWNFIGAGDQCCSKGWAILTLVLCFSHTHIFKLTLHKISLVQKLQYVCVCVCVWGGGGIDYDLPDRCYRRQHKYLYCVLLCAVLWWLLSSLALPCMVFHCMICIVYTWGSNSMGGPKFNWSGGGPIFWWNFGPLDQNFQDQNWVMQWRWGWWKAALNENIVSCLGFL